MDEEAREYTKKQGGELTEEKRKHREGLEETKSECREVISKRLRE